MTQTLALAEFDWTAIVTNLGFGGFVMWFAWHTQTHIIPAILTQHKDEREQTRKDFLQAIADSRRDYLESEQSQRADYIGSRAADRNDMQALIAAVTKLAEATNTHVGEARAVWRVRGELVDDKPKITEKANN